MAEPKLTKKDKEYIEEQELSPNGLPEAPVSITVRGYYKGFSVLITKRNAEGKVELEKIIEAIDNMETKGFKPSWADEREIDKDPTWIKETDKQTKTKSCECGKTKTLKTGVSKAGKPWAGWFCEDKECSFSPEWVNLTKK